ncbi:transmembrane protein 179B isoform X2 [Ornithorhynchus anatinus]|uniref:transmembrane protein 179B isoform X2 n=1 Tax=Ornithorhynchus anatinus TaxID=9258 RepID=UPI00028F359C|nr:transmembrane protein 179B isoform X2 [Ornithorhynchus anatinus]
MKTASFGGSCPLYGRPDWNGSVLSLPQPSAPSLCYFVAGTSGFLGLYCLLVLLYWIYSSYIEDSPRGRVALGVSLAVSAVGVSAVLLTACILQVGTDSLCASLVRSKAVKSCPEVEKISWTPPGTGLQSYTNLHNATAASWVSLALWCLILMLQGVEWKYQTPPFRPSERGDPEWSSETDALFRSRPSPTSRGN